MWRRRKDDIQWGREDSITVAEWFEKGGRKQNHVGGGGGGGGGERGKTT